MGVLRRNMAPWQRPPFGARLDRLHPLAVGLVAKFALLEGAGPVTANLTERVATSATLTAGALWSPSTRGALVRFDATDDTLALPSTATFLTAGVPCTLAWWEWVVADTVAYPDRFSFPIAGAANAFASIRAQTDINFANLVWGIGEAAVALKSTTISTTAASVGRWVHLALVGTAGPTSRVVSDWRIYEDGVQKTVVQSGAIGAASNTLARIGQFGNSGANCLLDDLSIYERALSTDEIRALRAEPFAMLEPA